MVGARIVTDVHYIAIDLGDGNSINTLLTDANAVSTIETAIRDATTTEINLVQGESLPTTFTSTADYQSRNLQERGVFSQREETTYRLIPMNGFSLDATNTTINGATTITRVIGSDGTVDTTTTVPIIGTDGSVNLLINDQVRSWQVDFIRAFPRVPTDPTATPEAAAGQYLYHGGWRPFTTTSPVTLS